MKQLVQRSDAERQSLQSAIAAELARDSGVVFAYLFGSFLEERPFHDIDVAVYLATSDARQQMEIAVRLSDTLTELTRVPVDVSVLNDAPIPFAFHAMHGDLLTCRDDDALTRVLAYTMSRYFDLEPILRRSFREVYEP